MANDIDPAQQLQDSREDIGKLLAEDLETMKGFKLQETLKITFKKPKD